MRRRNQILLGLGLAVLLLVLFFQQVDLAGVVEHLRAADLGLVALAVALSLLTTLQRAWRWQFLLAPLGWIGLRSLWECTVMGWALTTVLPGRLGEIARPVLIARREGLSKSAAFATVILERVFDVLVLLSILGAYLALLPLPSALGAEGRSVMAGFRIVGAVSLAGLVAGVVVLVVIWWRPDAVTALGERLVSLLPEGPASWLRGVGRAFASGLAGMRRPRLMVAVFLQSVFLWGTIVLSFWVMFHAFDLDVPWYAVFPLLLLVVLGAAVPTPAAVGSFHAAARVGLATLWGVPDDAAVGYAIACHAVAFLPLAILGLPLLWREGFTIGELQRLESEADSA